MSAFELVSSLGSFQSRSTHSVRVQSPHKFYTEYAYIEKYGYVKLIRKLGSLYLTPPNTYLLNKRRPNYK